MLDFHTHILPGIDDGSRDVETSLKMLQLSARQGVRGIVLTPHFYGDREHPEDFLRRRNAAFSALVQGTAQLSACPGLLLGAEVHYYRGMGRSEDVTRLCIGSSNLILVEMPFCTWTSQMLRDIEELHTHMGCRVIIAHIDRYLPMQPRDSVTALRTDCKAILQANAEAFFQRGKRRRVLKMLEQKEIRLLGSDCHNLTSRPPNLKDAADYIRGKLGDSPLHAVDQLGARLFELGSSGGSI